MESGEAETGRRTGELLAGRHRLGRLIGEGGFGVVYEAFDETAGREVAIKILHGYLVDVRDVASRFRREASVMQAVRHPNVVEVLDAGVAPDGTLYFAMERLHGADLAAYLDATGPLRVGVAARLARDVATALTAVHAAGIVHRDLKPDNVFLVEPVERAEHGSGTHHVKLLDFGVAKVVDGSGDVSSTTRTGTTIGTAYYMSPEQAQARKNVDARADLYALGVILFRMLSGVHPFEDDSYPLLVVKICTEPPPPIESYRADVPPALARLVNSLLAKDRDERPASAAEVSQRLEAFLGVDDEPRLLAGHDRSAPPRALRIESPLAHAQTLLSDVDDLPLAPRSPARIGLVVAAGLAALAIVVLVGIGLSRGGEAEVAPVAEVELPRPAPAIQQNMFRPSTNAEGYRFLNPVPRALPTFHDVAIGGPGVVAFAGREGALFVFADRSLGRVVSGTRATLHSVAWTGTEDLVAVGDEGTLVAVHGGEARSIETHVERSLRDLVVLSPREWVLVGDGGTFVRVVGERASAIDTARDEDLLGATAHGEDVFAVGVDGVVLRWNRQAISAESSGTRRVLRAIGACPGGDLYAVGDEGTILHRSASGAWGPVATRSRETFTGLACRDGRMLASGAQGGVLVIGGLRSVRLESGDERAFHAIDAMANGGVWVVGAGGRLAGVGPDRVLRLTSGVTKTFFDLASIAGVWVAVGADGTVARAAADGRAGFESIASPLASGLGGIAELDGATAIAVGDLGAILSVTLRGVRVLASPTEKNLRDVIAGEGSIVAVGADGTVVRGNEGSFFVTTVPGTSTLRAIAGTPARAMAVGDAGAVVRITSASLARLECGLDANLRGVVVDGEHAFAVGDGGIVVRIDGDVCTVEHRGGPDLMAIGPASDGGWLAVGEDGSALRRTPAGTYEALAIDTGGYDLFAVHADDREVLLVGSGGVVLRAPRLVVPSRP